jgi:hypothetical protein
VTKLKIEHFENDMQMRTYLITEADGKQDFCYEDDGDYKAIRHLQRRLDESNQLQDLLVAKAAANYNEQQKRIAELEADSRWVSVEDRLPELEDNSVLAVFPDGSIDMVHIVDYFEPITAGRDKAGKQLYTHYYLTEKITHWMPLPTPPAKEQGSSLLTDTHFSNTNS